jgi:transglutaminase-like putative cysteine protease
MNRREFLKDVMLGIGSIIISSRDVAAAVDDRKVKALSLRITYKIEILKQPSGKKINIWMPIPPSDREQEVSDLSVRSRISYRETEDASQRNRMFFFSTDKIISGDKIITSFRIKRHASRVVKELSKNPKMYMKPSEWEKWDDDNIAKFVDGLVGNERNPVKIGRKIYDAVIERLSYVHEVCGRGVSAITFEERMGRCDEFHALFRSMMMYKGIPAKWEQGIILPYPSQIQKSGKLEADCINAHSWIKFYIGGNRWMPVDLSEAKRRPDLRDFYFGNLPPNRIKMSEGRGITLNPKQECVINTFSYAYAEADGIPLIYGHHYRNVMKYELIKMEI